MNKLTGTLEISTELLDDFMWPPREDAADVPDWLRFDAESGWWMCRDRRFKSGWRKLIERAPVDARGARAVRPHGLRTWRPGQPDPS